MAIDINITGLTQAQQQEVADAFSGVSPIPLNDQGQPLYTKARWVKLQLLRHIKAVVKGWHRTQAEATLSTQMSTVDAAYGDEVV